LQIKTKIVICHTADSKPVKQEVNGTVILLTLVFPGQTIPGKYGSPNKRKRRRVLEKFEITTARFRHKCWKENILGCHA
jgi:hypothetical protein